MDIRDTALLLVSLQLLKVKAGICGDLVAKYMQGVFQNQLATSGHMTKVLHHTSASPLFIRLAKTSHFVGNLKQFTKIQSCLLACQLTYSVTHSLVICLMHRSGGPRTPLLVYEMQITLCGHNIKHGPGGPKGHPCL